MKINKTLIILSLLLIFCISLGAVSATDNDNINIDDVSIQDNDISVIEINTVSNTNNEREISELSADSANFDELQNAVDNAPSGSTLYLTKDYKFVSGNDNDGVSIGKSLTIDGQGHTINGSGTSRAFYVDCDNVVFKNINFVNTYRKSSGEEGGAICVDGIATISDCNFTDSFCNLEGGAIFIRGGNISNCIFTNCKANDDGGAIAIWDKTGTISNCIFTNCHIKDNDDDYDGGAIYLDKGGTVSGCNFLNCSHDGNGEGGAICSDGTANINGCNFTNSFCNYEGGAIFIRGGSISNCIFTNCSADDDGGAIAIWGNSGTVSDCVFINCYIDKNGDYDGGAIYFDDDGTVTNCSFTDCHTYGDDGGAIDIEGDGRIEGCNFINCFADDGDGGAVVIWGSGTVTGCNFTNCYINNNSHKFRGGAIYLDDGGTVLDCNFLNCTNYGGDGGAIYLDDGGTVLDCNFTNCNAFLVSDYYAYGGAVYISGSGTIGDCNFLNCSVDYGSRSCGVVVIEATSNIYNCTFNNCDGVALYLESDGTVINSNFVNCTQRSICDIYGVGCFNICNCTFTDDVSFFTSDSPDSICISEGTIENCVFLRANRAYIMNGYGNVINCNFTDSEGITMSGTSTNTVSNCNFINCTPSSSYYGGAIYIRYSGSVSGCSFVNCSCNYNDTIDHDRYGYGGAIYITNDGDVSNCSFTNCYAFTSAGALSIGSVSAGGVADISNCSFTNCSSSDYAGAIFIWDGTISNCSFVNSSANDGGAIYANMGTINNSTFDNCSSLSSAGAIFIYYDGAVNGCNFTNCNAKVDSAMGGAVFIGGECKVNSCNFISCFATMGGALFVVEGDVGYCNFTNCYAKGNNSMGGAICRVADYTEGDITNCNFVNCYTTATNTSLGGAIFNCAIATSGITGHDSDCSIKLSNFTNCYAKGNNESEGGAIYMVSNDADNTWHNGMPLVNKVLTVASFSASKPILGLIGTIFGFVKWVVPGSDGYTQCISCNFLNCNASSKGGAISLEGENYVGDCNFTNNYAPKGSSIFIWDDAELEIASSYAYDVPSNVASIFIDDIGELDSNIIITTIDNKIKHVDNGQVVNLNATITTDTGMSVAGGLLTFTVNGKSLDAKSGVDGIYSTNRAGNNYTVDFIGTKPVNAEFDDDYWEGDATVIMGNLTTNRLDVNLVADSVKGTPGEKLNVTIKVTDINNDPVTGGVVTVEFEGNEYEANVVDGVATVELYLPRFGEYSVSAFYNGSTSSLYNDGSLDFTVYAKDFASVVVYTKDNISYGEILTVYGHVTGVEGKSAPTGNVTVYVDGVEKGTVNLTENGDISYFIPNLAGGKHIITLRYNGDENYAFEEGSANVTVYPTIFDDLFMIITILNDNITWYFAPSSTPIPPHSLTPIPMVPYDPHHVIASSHNNGNGISNVKSLSYDSFNPYLLLTNGVANGLNGKILLILDGHLVMVDLINSHGNLTCNGLNAGIHRVTAIFLGNENYTRLKASTIFYIPKSSSDTVCTIEDVDYGDNVTIAVNVTGVDGKIPTGNVTIIINNNEIGTVNITNGTVTYSIPKLVSGDYNITVIYNGDKNYNASEFSSKFTVNQLNVSVVVDSVKGETGEKVNIIVRVTDEKGNPVKEGTVIIGFNGKQYKANVVNGIATIEVVLPKAGTYSATAYYEGFNYNSSYTTFIVKVSDIPCPNPNPAPVNKGVGNMENTGNPLLVLLIALAAIGLESLRRKF